MTQWVCWPGRIFNRPSNRRNPGLQITDVQQTHRRVEVQIYGGLLGLLGSVIASQQAVRSTSVGLLLPRSGNRPTRPPWHAVDRPAQNELKQHPTRLGPTYEMGTK